MNVLNIRPVKSGQSKIVIGIAGVSGSGKTYTALKIARGMVDKPSEIGFLDTENGRGSLYANILDGEFMIADLYPPFSPSRYAQAIKEFQDSGVKVLVIDSVTHEWEGEGGCDDIANAPKADGTPRKIADWNTAKREHKKFMNTLLQSSMNIIACIRAREKTDFKDPNKPVSLGIQPVCEKNFMFELTTSVLLDNQGSKQIILKPMSFVKDALIPDSQGYLGFDNGKKIREWLEKGDVESDEIVKIKSEALLICEQGYNALNEYWKTIPKELKSNASLLAHFKVCTESAKAYDKQNEEPEESNKIQMIADLFSLKQLSLSDEDRLFIQNVIDTKDEVNYDKVLFNLNNLK